MTTRLGVDDGPRADAFRAAMAAVGGPPIEISRIFVQADVWDTGEWRNVLAAISAGRVPVASFHSSGSWSAFGSGGDRARLDQIVGGLESVDVSKLPDRPWLTFNHEPEGDGTPADYNKAWAWLLANYGVRLRAAGWGLCWILQGGTFVGNTKWTLTQVEQAMAGIDVDGIFADIYDWRKTSGTQLEFAAGPSVDFTDPTKAFVRYLDWVKAKGKVAALTEFGTLRTQADAAGVERADFLGRFGAWPRVGELAFVSYFDLNQGQAGAVHDWAIDAEPDSMRAFGTIARVSLADELAAAKARVEVLLALNADLNGWLADAKANLDADQAVIDSLTAERDQLTGDLTLARAATDQVSAQLDELAQRISAAVAALQG